MVQDIPNMTANDPCDLLNEIYDAGGLKIITNSQMCSHLTAVVVELVRLGAIQTNASPDGEGVICEMTQSGLKLLTNKARANLCSALGVGQLSREDVIIEKACRSSFDVGRNIRLSSVRDFIEKKTLNIWGHHRYSNEPILVGTITLKMVNAEAAMYSGGAMLQDIIKGSEILSSNKAAFSYDDDDHAIPQHIYDLADMLELPDGIGANIIFIEKFVINPALVGLGMGKESLKKVLFIYGKGGGIILTKIRPVGTNLSSSNYSNVSEKLIKYFSFAGFHPHPFVKSYVVGSIRNICGY